MNHFQSPSPPPATAGNRALFVTYDGLTDPLGRSQILPYLAGLSERGHRITVLSCEKADRFAADEASVRAICDRHHIAWAPLAYHRRPPVLSALYDIAHLTLSAWRLHREAPFDLLHCRSYIPGLVGLALKRAAGVPFIFDMRGFWPEERTESGEWDLSKPLYRAIYNFFKRAECRLLAKADHVVSLTHAGTRVLKEHGRDHDVTVIPCCVDFEHFVLTTVPRKTMARAQLGIPADAAVLGYLGSLGGNHLLGEMLDFYAVFRDRNPGSRFLFVTQTPRAFVEAAAAARRVPLFELIIKSASREQVPLYISAADVGVAFKRAEYSSIACSPTKLGEMLAAGIPVVANAGVGDVATILSDTSGGLAVTEFTPKAYRTALDDLATPRKPRELRQAAVPWYDLQNAITAYDGIYRVVGANGLRAERHAGYQGVQIGGQA